MWSAGGCAQSGTCTCEQKQRKTTLLNTYTCMIQNKEGTVHRAWSIRGKIGKIVYYRKYVIPGETARERERERERERK